MDQMVESMYLSQWYDLALSEKKMFLIILVQLQTRLNTNAYGLIELNMEAYGKVYILKQMLACTKSFIYFYYLGFKGRL